MRAKILTALEREFAAALRSRPARVRRRLTDVNGGPPSGAPHAVVPAASLVLHPVRIICPTEPRRFHDSHHSGIVPRR